MGSIYISQFNRGEQLLNLLGTFWLRNFKDRTALRDYNLGLAQIHGHNYIKILESIATLSRFDIPVFSENLWDIVTIRASDRDSNLLTYGDGSLYGDPIVFGGASAGVSNKFRLRSELKELYGCFLDSPINPEKVWLPDSVQIENGFITFNSDPFTEITTGRIITDDLGAEVDTEIDLFVYRGGYDLNLVYNHFGYVLGIKMESSEFFKDLLNILWTGHNEGCSVSNLLEILHIIIEIPWAKGDEEIELIEQEGQYNLVITDKNVYYIPFTIILLPEIVIGASLDKYQQFTSALKVLELSEGILDIGAITAIDLPRLSFGSGFIAPLIDSTISAENKDVPLVTVGMSGPNPLLEFELSGYPQDIMAFWERVRQSEITTGKTFAEYLVDKYSFVPVTINPLLFMLEEILRENLTIIKFDQSGYSELHATKEFMLELYKLVAAHTTFLVFVEVIAPEIIIDTEEILEEITVATGSEVEDDYNCTTIVENVIATLVPDLC